MHTTRYLIIIVAGILSLALGAPVLGQDTTKHPTAEVFLSSNLPPETVNCRAGIVVKDLQPDTDTIIEVEVAVAAHGDWPAMKYIAAKQVIPSTTDGIIAKWIEFSLVLGESFPNSHLICDPEMPMTVRVIAGGVILEQEFHDLRAYNNFGFDMDYQVGGAIDEMHIVADPKIDPSPYFEEGGDDFAFRLIGSTDGLSPVQFDLWFDNPKQMLGWSFQYNIVNSGMFKGELFIYRKNLDTQEYEISGRMTIPGIKL